MLTCVPGSEEQHSLMCASCRLFNFAVGLALGLLIDVTGSRTGLSVSASLNFGHSSLTLIEKSPSGLSLLIDHGLLITNPLQNNESLLFREALCEMAFEYSLFYYLRHLQA